MICKERFERENISIKLLNIAFVDDSGSWWWWTNLIGIYLFGFIGLIGNFICFLVIHLKSSNHQSFLVYLRCLCLFDFLTLFFEILQSSNDFSIYLFERMFLNFGNSFVCKCYDYIRYSITLLSSWTIVSLTIDRLILVCQPFDSIWPNFSRRYSNPSNAKRVLSILIISSFLINIPELISKEWICRNEKICRCRISSRISRMKLKYLIEWNTYIYHLLIHTLIPTMILLISNIAILKSLYKPRQIISNQNESIRSRLTLTLSLISICFVFLYFPYGIVQTISYLLIQNVKRHCNVGLILNLHKLKRLTELLNIIALGINFYFYILGIRQYRNATLRMLKLNYFIKTDEPICSSTFQRNHFTRSNANDRSSSLKLLRVTLSAEPSSFIKSN